MSKRLYGVWAGLLVTPAVAAVTAMLSIQAMWGINHLLFLPAAGWLVFAAVVFVVILLVASRSPLIRLENGIDSFSRLLFDRGAWPRLSLAMLCTTLFWVLRTPTHFLGDGYTLISSMGKGDSYIIKWTESGTIALIRTVQWLLGGYTRETSLAAFQIVSMASGAVVVHNLVLIACRLVSDNRLRLFALMVTLLSGALLLFCGYAEYYPALWAAATTFIALSLRYARTGRGVGWVAVSFVVSCLAHLEALVFLPGLVFLLAHVELQQKRQIRIGRAFTILLVAASTAAGAAFMYLYATRIEFETIFLPMFTGRPRSPEYAVFTQKHLLDILNQILLVCPLVLPALALAVHKRKQTALDPTHAVLALFASGSLLFLFVIDPVLGLGRDWDLMSLIVLPLVLYLLYRIGQTGFEIPARAVATSGLIGLVMTGLFLAANADTTASERRIHELLRYYGARNRSGWVIFANYYLDNGDERMWKAIGAERDSYFPEDQKLIQAHDFLAKAQYERVQSISSELLAIDPYRGDYYQLRANLYDRLRQYDSAETNYRTAIKLIPYATQLKYEFAQMLLNSGQFGRAADLFRQVRSFDHSSIPVAEGLAISYYFLGSSDSAIALADSLFMADPNSPGGHLIHMIVAIRDDDQKGASFHYSQFVLYGKSRSDWAPIQEHYKYLQ